MMTRQVRSAVQVELEPDEDRIQIGAHGLIALVAAIYGQRQRVGELPFGLDLLTVDVATGSNACIVEGSAEGQVGLDIIDALQTDITILAAGRAGVVAAALQRQGNRIGIEPVRARAIGGGVAGLEAPMDGAGCNASEPGVQEQIAASGPQIGAAGLCTMPAGRTLEVPVLAQRRGQAAIQAVQIGSSAVRDAGVAAAKGASDWAEAMPGTSMAAAQTVAKIMLRIGNLLIVMALR